ncbi:apoptosis-associated speck-like protein containing a CARD [Engraulis encrasicolus]|uniref:apoptosis-associated speck-like protein containing a CARD n=1 Tax=Engraulis encrasicolus TaxID=184585 RepID=UPI002FCE9E65
MGTELTDMKEKIAQLELKVVKREEELTELRNMKREMEEMKRQIKVLQELARPVGEIANTSDQNRRQDNNRDQLNKTRQHGDHFVDRHRTDLIQCVTAVDSVLDKLLKKKVIDHEIYNNIKVKKTRQDQMRELLAHGNIRCLKKGKDILYKTLREIDPFMVKALEEKESSDDSQ